MSLRPFLQTTLVVLAIVLVLTAIGSVVTPAGAQRIDAEMVRDIHRYRDTTVRLQRVMGIERTLSVVHSRTSLERARDLWRRRALTLKRKFQAGPPHRREWKCIHDYEGSWTDSGAPYYGGLQMDVAFQRHYGDFLLRTKGTADKWTPLEQMWVAEKAYRSGRGFYPWPNTARYCGLI